MIELKQWIKKADYDDLNTVFLLVKQELRYRDKK